ncbi:hypothetical protein FB45DRAFT_878750 [Roridomyces roridus]|uniref:F-box domain-containing protein n=1 Tax=Roridomyces roridus TaxID=1738132 RepID=A0AAD7F926_9AGAR|nr:hypothetical protein FB45DRAFT_878750 [Roridomyces roridus]
MEPPIPLATVLSWGNELAPLPEALVARPWIAVAENELGRIERDIQALEASRLSLLHKVSTYRQAFAPHKNLPPELLGEIFIACAASQSGDGSVKASLNYVVRTRSDVRFTLRRVCSKWCAIVMGTPKLWSDLQMNFAIDTREVHISVKLFLTWISLAGEHPLTLDLSMAYDRSDLAPTLLGCARRLRSLTVGPLANACVQDLFRLPVGSMGCLEKLTLTYSTYVRGYPPAYREPEHSTVFLGSGHLRSVTLVSFSDAKLKTVAIPWGQLTELNLEQSRVSRTRLESILSLSPALTRARVWLPHDNAPRSWNITLPVLRNLTLYTPLLDIAAEFCQAISHPVWRNLRSALPWLIACGNAEEIILPHCVLGTATPLISTGLLFPNLRLLFIHSQDFHAVLPMLKARRKSQQHPTIPEVGFTGRVHGITKLNRETVGRLLKAGVFICDEDQYKTGELWRGVYRGQIEDRAGKWSDKGLGLFRFVEETKSPFNWVDFDVADFERDGDSDSD